MSAKFYDNFMLQEGLRQDAAINATAAQLASKNGLFMVFAAFVFTAEATLASVGSRFGLELPRWGWGVSLMLSLVGIIVLLYSAKLEKYRLPPILPLLREQAEQFFSLPDIKQLPDGVKMEKFQEKFLNSISRSVRDNFDVNTRIARNLEYASYLIGASVLCLLGALLWILANSAVTFFAGL